jgi:hypothetical protein
MSSASARAADASRAAAAADTSAAGEDADHDPVHTLACRVIMAVADHGSRTQADLGVCDNDSDKRTQRHSLSCDGRPTDDSIDSNFIEHDITRQVGVPAAGRLTDSPPRKCACKAVH